MAYYTHPTNFYRIGGPRGQAQLFGSRAGDGAGRDLGPGSDVRSRYPSACMCSAIWRATGWIASSPRSPSARRRPRAVRRCAWSIPISRRHRRGAGTEASDHVRFDDTPPCTRGRRSVPEPKCRRVARRRHSGFAKSIKPIDRRHLRLRRHHLLRLPAGAQRDAVVAESRASCIPVRCRTSSHTPVSARFHRNKAMARKPDYRGNSIRPAAVSKCAGAGAGRRHGAHGNESCQSCDRYC